MEHSGTVVEVGGSFFAFIEENAHRQFVRSTCLAGEAGNGEVVTQSDFKHILPYTDHQDSSIGISKSVPVPRAPENRADSRISPDV